MKDLRGKVAVVTGAGSGIGQQVSIALGKKGCHLSLVDIDQQRLDETAGQVTAQGVRASTHIVDVSDKKAVRNLAADVYEIHKCINILVNNAGVMVIDGFETHSMDDFEWLFSINFWGVVYGCRYFLPYLRASGSGHIVNISSMYGFYGLPAQTSYCASKFAVRGFSESLRAELQGSSVSLTCVHPGAISTNLIADAHSHHEGEGSFKELGERLMGRIATSPETAAKRIVRSIERNKARLRFGLGAFISDYCVRLNPVVFNKLVGVFKGYMGFVPLDEKDSTIPISNNIAE